MHTGMLWFDDSKETLETKIDKAIMYYEKKYGYKPNLACVHPSMIQGEIKSSITVRPYRPVLPGHIWIGVQDEAVTKTAV